MLPECVCERRWWEEDSGSRVGEGWSVIVEGVAGGPANRQTKAVNVHELQRNNHCHMILLVSMFLLVDIMLLVYSAIYVTRAHKNRRLE